MNAGSFLSGVSRDLLRWLTVHDSDVDLDGWAQGFNELPHQRTRVLTWCAIASGGGVLPAQRAESG